MATTSPIPAARPDPVTEFPPPPRPDAVPPEISPVAQEAGPTVAERQPSTRLMIEDVGGRFVYTVLDNDSGRVLAVIPREQVEALAKDETYAAGRVIDAKA